MLKNYKRGLCILSTATAMIVASTLSGQTVKWRNNAVKGTDDQVCGDVATDGSGNVYAAGTFKTTAVFGTTVFTNADPGGGFTDGYVVKYNRVSTLAGTPTRLWSIQVRQNGAIAGANERVSAIATYPDGTGGFDTYIVGSYTVATDLISDPGSGGLTLSLPAGASGSQSGFIAKCNNAGAVIWAYPIDGVGADTPYDVCVSQNGSGGIAIYVAGSCGAAITCQAVTVSMVGLANDAFLLRLDDAGFSANALWGRAMGTSLSGNDAFYAVASTTNGDVVVTGQIKGNGFIQNGIGTTAVACFGSTDIVAARFNGVGILTYVINGGGTTATDAGLATAIDMYGNSYVAGYFSGICNISSFTRMNLGAGWDYFILKLDPAGNGIWMRSGGTNADGDAIQSIVVNNLATRIYVTGNFKGAMSYNGSAITLNAYSTTNIDGFMLAADANTGLLLSGGELQFGGATGDDNGRAIAINAAEDVYIGSSVSSSTTNLDWTSSTSFLTNSWTVGTYETGLIRWDHSNWPALANNNSCLHKGIGEWFDPAAWQWKVSMGGSFNGTVTFPTLPAATTLTSTSSLAGPPSQDAYITTCSTFGDYLSFVNVMNGNGEELLYDHMTDGAGNNYFTGYGTVVIGENFNFVGGPGYAMTQGVSAGFLGKRSKSGGHVWGVYFHPLTHYSAVEAEGIAMDYSGNIYVTGGFIGPISLGTTSGSPYILGSAGVTSDIFVAKYNNSGVLQWARSFGSANGDPEKGFSISVDSNNYYVTGRFNTLGSLVFGTNTLGPTLNNDIFVMKGDASTGAALKGFQYSSANADAGMDVISPNSTACYITGALNNTTQCITGRVDFSPAIPVWSWMATNTTGGGAASVSGTDLIMGNNGHLFVAGYATAGGTLTFGTLSETVAFHGFMVSYDNLSGTPACLEIYDFPNTINPNPKYTRTYAIALESGTNSPDHGDNVLIGGSKGHSTTTNISFAQKITTEGCVVSERRPNPVVPYTVSESALYGSLVYPNPLNGIATLEIRTDVDFSSTQLTVVITDMTGREVSRINGITTKLIDIHAENFSDGLYYYQVMQENKMISNGKMVVHH